MSFFERLQRDTAADRQRLYAAPLIRAAFAGQVGRADYIAFLTQAYHHVRHTVPLLMACGARLGAEDEWLRTKIAHYIEEEIGHQEWILDDIREAGGDAEAVRHGRPHAETELMVAYAYDTIARGNPLGFFGMVYVLESTSIELATGAASTLQGALGLPKKAFTYLSSHGAVDVEHIDFFRELVEQLRRDEDREAVLHAAHMFFRLYGDVFRSIEPMRKAA
ncbi:TenA family transcriptional regulator [Solimonas soli]|uniref:TenA family transcriptional regulator n=1 Tax=Solimonas soli TaxID=413479 RepID=UPI00048739EB|nr:iron-containing redox enzyme family protein [Solimonas soli]